MDQTSLQHYGFRRFLIGINGFHGGAAKNLALWISRWTPGDRGTTNYSVRHKKCRGMLFLHTIRSYSLGVEPPRPCRRFSQPDWSKIRTWTTSRPVVLLSFRACSRRPRGVWAVVRSLPPTPPVRAGGQGCVPVKDPCLVCLACLLPCCPPGLACPPPPGMMIITRMNMIDRSHSYSASILLSIARDTHACSLVLSKTNPLVFFFSLPSVR
jgi:hypothetical protein